MYVNYLRYKRITELCFATQKTAPERFNRGLIK